MLKDEERIAEVKRRIAKKEQQQRLRRRRIISAVCIAACFAVIVGISFAMPGIIGRFRPRNKVPSLNKSVPEMIPSVF